MGIARNIEIYHQAFHLAREHIARDGDLNGRAGIVKQLHEAIRHELQSGASDVVAIAANAIRKLQTQRADRANQYVGQAGAAGVD
jgi:hypothetical protein